MAKLISIYWPDIPARVIGRVANPGRCVAVGPGRGEAS
jgi:hypothetical protein